MRRRFVALLFCSLLIAAACTDDDDPGSAGPTASPNGVRRVGGIEVEGECAGLGRLRRAQISFVAHGEVFVAPRNGTARCALRINGAGDLEWGPKGDRLHFGDLRRYDGTKVVTLSDSAESISWSRPTGQAIVYVSDGKLKKVDAFATKPFNISFLAEHDEVAYHPAGTHVATTGTDEDGTYGLWLSTNLGQDHQLLAVGESARRIFSLSWSHGGATIYYAAEHAKRYDIHSLQLALKDKKGAVRDARLATLDSDTEPIDDVVASEFLDGTIAYTVGSCAEGKQTRVWRDGSVTLLGGSLGSRSTEPVGWLPNGELLVLARNAGCSGPATLYAWSDDATSRLVAGVSAAGVRVQLPPPPNPPGSEQEVVA